VNGAVEAADIIVIGEVVAPAAGEGARVRPEAFLKGPARAQDLVLLPPQETPNCPPAELATGSRVLLLLLATDKGIAWPAPSQVFLLEDGMARHMAPADEDPLEDRSEDQLVSLIRGQTEQYAVPAESRSEGAGIDWWSTIVPVGVASLGLLAVGFYLMRIWHRIDPS